MKCGYILPSKIRCTREGKIELDDKYYCKCHYNNMIRYQNKYHVNEENYRNKVIEILNKECIIYTEIEFITSDYFILIYKIKINNKDYICKIQLIDEFKNTSLYQDYILVKNIFKNTDLILNLANDIKSFYYSPKKYMIVINEPILCTLSSIINILDKDTIYCIITRLIKIIEYIHNNKYMYLDLSINKLVITNNGVKILLYNPCSKFINERSEFYPNVAIRDMLGDPIYGSININSMFSGTRLDDLESILWIYLKMTNDSIINDLIGTKSISTTIKLKEIYIFNNKEKNNYIKQLYDQTSYENIKPVYTKFLEAIQK